MPRKDTTKKAVFCVNFLLRPREKVYEIPWFFLESPWLFAIFWIAITIVTVVLAEKSAVEIWSKLFVCRFRYAALLLCFCYTKKGLLLQM
ncbi:MAG: hypothetical protein EAZ92_08770 [Candidatus Kapaibacterium sp.]|nr:MAG: hypothetical protein EAZ92_08770 [Candidatus Kapabacteria bacterium]